MPGTDTAIPISPPPPGFVPEAQASAIPPPPPGFVPEQSSQQGATPPPGFVPESQVDPQSAIKQKYGLPEGADLSKPFLDPANEAVKDAAKFSQAYDEFNPPTQKTTSQRIADATRPWEGAMAPRTAEEALSGAEMAAGEGAGNVAWSGLRRFAPEIADSLEAGASKLRDWLSVKTPPVEDIAGNTGIGKPGTAAHESGYYPQVTKVPIRPTPPYRLTAESIPGPDTAGKGNLLSPLAKKGDPRAAAELMRRGRAVLYVPAEEYTGPREVIRFDESGRPYATPGPGRPLPPKLLKRN